MLSKQSQLKESRIEEISEELDSMRAKGEGIKKPALTLRDMSEVEDVFS
jgi:hypothetical protein